MTQDNKYKQQYAVACRHVASHQKCLFVDTYMSFMQEAVITFCDLKCDLYQMIFCKASGLNIIHTEFIMNLFFLRSPFLSAELERDVE